MKIKKLTKSIAAVLLGATMGFSAFAFVGCGDDDNNDDKPVTNVADATVTVSLDKTTIDAGSTETVTATATVTEFADKTVAWSLTGEGAAYADINAATGVITLKTNLTPKFDVAVTVVATSVVSASVKGSATLTIKAQVIEGQVGALTTEMFTALGNSRITVTGEVEDIVDDFKNDNNDSSQKYDYKVMMDDGKWYGEWNRNGSTDKDISNYRRSADVISGTDTHTFNQVYIDKDNKVAQKPVTDYNSDPGIWENMHMWNHLARLAQDINSQWEYDAITKIHSYVPDNNDLTESGDIYFRTYLANSLTPMMENETLESIEISTDDIVDGKITKMTATAGLVYYGGEYEGSSQGATSMKYTKVTFIFSDVGTTDVPDPTPYEAPEFGDALVKAIDSMKGVKNYTFNAVETTVSAPSYDEGDYTIDSVSTFAVSNGTSSKGTEGIVGKVTEDAILLARTGKYSASMDDNVYHTEYTGYKKIDANTYDYFEYDSSLKALAGKRQYKGDMFDTMPKFDFSPNVFEFLTPYLVKVGDKYEQAYVYALREPAITRDIAMQVSAHSYATDAQGSTHGTFKITVLPDGTLLEIEYPYSLVSGTYLGVIRTTYTKVGNTEIEEDVFANYVPREVRDTWSKFNVRYYYPNHSTQSISAEIDAGTLFNQIFPGKADKLPSPLSFVNVFGDSMTDAFFEWEDEDNTATGGGVVHHDYLSMNVSIDEYDENMKVSDEIYNKYKSALTAELAKDGFALSTANTAVTYWGDRYMTFISENGTGNIMIKIHNNRTRFFFIDILPVGMWSYDPSNSVAPNA